MRISFISIKNHPGIGDIYIDFRDDYGSIFSTIILAGANGAGKTAILNAVQTLFEGKIGANIGIIEIGIIANKDEIEKIKLVPSIGMKNLSEKLSILYDSGAGNDWIRSYSLFSHEDDGQKIKAGTPVISAQEWKGVLRTFYSEASVNFNPNRIGSITSKNIDNSDFTTRRSSAQLASEITQLIVDIRASDAEELAEWVAQNPGMVPPDDVKNRRFARFINAFEYMFEDKKFVGVKREGDRLKVEFSEFGRISDISELSTGEKQIVFRAGFFLRDLFATKDAIVLIDEPELSLHPDWQAKIMGFYIHLLSDEGGSHPQLICGTHSPFIIHGCPSAKVLILEKNRISGEIAIMNDPVYPSVGSAAAIHAFNIDGFFA